MSSSSTVIVPLDQVESAPRRGFRRLGVGAIIGGALGAVVAGPAGAVAGMVVGGGVGHATGGPRKPAVFAGAGPKGKVTESRVRIYREAMQSMRDPSELRALADAFDKERLPQFATMLRRRAASRELPKEQKVARQNAFRSAMSCDDPGKILALAAEFEGEGSTGSADALRSHAAAVRAAHMAGVRGKPVDDVRAIDKLGESLGKAIIHFGPDSREAKMAAATFLKARGVRPDDAKVAEVIKVAKEEIDAQGTQSAAAGADGADGSSQMKVIAEDGDGPIIDVSGSQTSTINEIATAGQGASAPAGEAPPAPSEAQPPVESST